MSTNATMAGWDLTEVSMMFVLIAVIIVLALIAAVGAWVRGGGIRREDAESLFQANESRQQEEIARLEKLLAEAREANEQAHNTSRDGIQRSHDEIASHVTSQVQDVASRMQALDSQVVQSRTSLESAMDKATQTQTAALSDEMELLSRKVNESESRVMASLGEMNENMNRLQIQMSQAGDQIRNALMEISQQQKEQKAQSTIQLCDALITSLGTLKSSIATQLTTGKNPDDDVIDAGSAYEVNKQEISHQPVDSLSAEELAEETPAHDSLKPEDSSEPVETSGESQESGYGGINVPYEDCRNSEADNGPVTDESSSFDPASLFAGESAGTVESNDEAPSADEESADPDEDLKDQQV